jgi:chromosomal replication initiation ATPase DnaA
MEPSALAEQLQTKRAHIKHLIATAAAANGVTYEAIMSRARPRDVCRARFDAIAAVSSAYPDMSFPRIGKIFNRDHSSIVHALMMRGVQPRSGRIAEYRKFAALMQRRAVGNTTTEGKPQ